jgi:two-component system OmpR family sensor kinase
MLRTMRGRLIAGLVALLAIACASVGVTSYIAVRNTLFRQLNSQLQIASNLAYKCEDQPASGEDGDRHRTPQGAAAAAGQEDKPVPGHPNWTRGASSIDCPGLGTGTLAVWTHHGDWAAVLVPDTHAELSATDKRKLSELRPSRPPGPGDAAPTYVRTLRSAGGDFALTAIMDPDGDGSVYITGLPLSGVYDLLKDVALLEAFIFAVVLVAAGVLGTLWVRLSLHPLRRVAATAAEVAELPLDAGEVALPAGVPDTDPATETGQVGAAFNRMLGHVQRALARRAASEARLRRFAADASHELRTPLAAIRGYAELALRRPGDTPEEVTHALRRVLSESTRMSVLVDDLLLLARLDAGRPLSDDPVDVTRLTIDATSDAQVARPGHRWVLDLPDDPVHVRGDEHRLHQVLANLLSNAGRHTPDGTTVTVTLTADAPVADGSPAGGGSPGDKRARNGFAGAVVRRAGGGRTSGESAGGDGHAGNGRAADGGANYAPGATVRRGVIPSLPRTVISVTDDGPGIPPELLPDLFERFTRADTARSHATDTDANSTGLGLAIVDAVVAAHRGAVLATSRPGLTRFTIVLPRLVTPPDDAPAPVGQSASLRLRS